MGLRLQGRYRIVSELGAGAFGTVCLADDEATTHEVAIRFLPGGPAGVANVMQALRRRGRSIVEVSAAHPALVEVLEFGEAENGQAFVAMEVAEGRRLSEILADGPLEVATALRWALELGAAIEALHNVGIVHGALRPRNVMIADNGSVKLMDVELTDLRDELVRTGMVSPDPPPEYLSPEQVRGGSASEKTDVYAFGVMLYEMLCGVPPFRGATSEATLAKHLTETPTPMRRRRRALPASVSSVVALALSKRAADRPLIHNLLNALWQEAHVPATRWKRRTVILGGAALAASIPVIVSWGLFMPRPPDVPPLSPPAPPVAAAPVPEPPVKRAPASSAIDTRPAPASQAPTPVTVPPAPMRTPPPSAPAPASRTARPEVPTQTRAPQPQTDVARERPAASSDTDDPDPGLVVDWLLEQAAARRK
jgi:serine/threonine-protein kinase